MKRFIAISLGLIAVLALALLIAAIRPKEFNVQATVEIARPGSIVFSYLKVLKNQEQYVKWFRLDPQMRTSMKGTDGHVGSVYSWDSENPDVGKGELEITNIQEDSRIDMELRFERPFVSHDPLSVSVESRSRESTRVTFRYSGTMRYPTNLMIPIFRSRIEADMQGNAQRLKSLLENPEGMSK